MKFLVFIFFVIALFAGGMALWAGAYIDSAAIVIGSFMAFASGSGFRASLHLKNPLITAVLISGALFGCSLAIMVYLDLTVDQIDGRAWAVIGAAVGFLATTKADSVPANKIDSTKQKIESEVLLEDCFAVVAAYGKLVEEYSGHVLPLEKLPLPKEHMKKTLQLVWAAVDDASIKSAIEVSYSFLANFREDVDKPAQLELQDVTAILERDSPNTELLAQVSDRLSLFQAVNADAIALANEFVEFKADQAS